MKKVVIILAVCFLSVAVNAAMDWDIYNDATIEDGDVYGTVNIYDTPPDQTLVEMLGGDISTCTINDSALLNYNGGDISVLKQYDFSISYIDSVDIPTMYLYGESQSHIHNGSFGPSIFLYDDAKVHIYGYNFDYDVFCFRRNWTFPEFELVCISKKGNGQCQTNERSFHRSKKYSFCGFI